MNFLLVFLKKYSEELLLGIILVGMILFSFSTLTTKPKLWADEAKSIELARNFLEHRKLDIKTAPGLFSGFPELQQTTGYAVTIPLAGFFYVFGFGLVQARIYMILWIAIVWAAIFFCGRKFFGAEHSILALTLISTFASFYGSGRTVVGEIPGFLFLIAGLYFWLEKNFYYWSGLFFGLAIITKPSVYVLILPTIFLVLLLERKDFFKKLLKVGIGMLPAALGWIMLVLDNPLLKATWISIAKFYQNPYSGVSLSENIWRNLLNVPYSLTLIYFGFLFFLIILGRYWEEDFRLKSFYNFVIIYSIFAFAYYLRSPGWLRYILVAELLILFSLPSALYLVLSNIKSFIPKLKLNSRWLSIGLATVLVGIQLFHLFNGAKIFYSNSEILASEFINREFPDKTIGTINSLALSILLKTDKRFQTVEMTGLPVVGKNPLSYDPLPEVIVFSPDVILSKENQAVLEIHYRLDSQIGSYFIYLLH